MNDEAKLQALLSTMSASQVDVFLTKCLGGNHSRTKAVPERQARRVRVIAAEVAERKAKARLRSKGWHYTDKPYPESGDVAYRRVYSAKLQDQLAMAYEVLGADER